MHEQQREVAAVEAWLVTMRRWSSVTLAALSISAAAGATIVVPKPAGKDVEIAPGVMMPSVSLGTCCGSDPKVGIPSWLKAGGVGIDTAED